MKKHMYFLLFTASVALLVVVVGCSNRPVEVENPTPTVIALVTPEIVSTSEQGTNLPQTLPVPRLTPTARVGTVLSTTSTPTPCPVPPGWAAYVVRSGDTLFRIAQPYGITAEELQNINCLPSAETIQVGQTIYVPYLFPTAIPVRESSSPPVQPVVQPDLKKEVFLNTGGEPPSPSCVPPASAIAPQFTISERLKDMYALCVYDFPQTEEVKVDLYAPDGHWVASKAIPQSVVLNGRTIIKIKLWMPVGSPTGLWSATARSASASLEKQPFLISPITDTAINTMPAGEVNPFDIEKACRLGGSGFYSRGEDVIIRGTNFSAISSLPIGIYRLYLPDAPQSDTPYVLRWISTQPAEVNQGNFSISIRIQPSDPSETYWVIPVLDFDEDSYNSFDFKNDCYKVQ
jgi:LysM repeat protein